jgi:NADPH-dependent 2,4-dienoyl-CoA reductase/sulfur reductase-like enzyme
MTEAIPLAVVGAGPAGLAAAAQAAELGLSVTLIDAFHLPGGQYYKQTASELVETAAPDNHAAELLATVKGQSVRLLTETSAWGIFPSPPAPAKALTTCPPREGRLLPLLLGEEGADQRSGGEGGVSEEHSYLLCLYGLPGTPRRLLAQTVILAPGAYDRPVPFPGWTLPGVMTAGAALTLVKHQHVLPGRRFLLSGSGPLQWVLARHLLDAGAEVAAVLDANPFPWRGWRHAAAVWGQWARLQEGWDSLRTMQKAGVGVRWGQWVWRAEGDGQVERAVIGPVGGPPAETLAADTICLGHGFTPAVQLSRLAGCEHRYYPMQRATAPIRNEWLQTTLPALFVVGDGAGIGGKDVARLEGQLAALGAARALGEEVDAGQVAALRRDLDRQRRFAAVLDALFPLHAHLADLLTDDTVLCRCEEITVGAIRRAIDEGATTVSAVRMVTRAGMGRCQGRMCGPSVAELLARELGQPVEAVGQPTPRPPVVPIPLDGLLDRTEEL